MADETLEALDSEFEGIAHAARRGEVRTPPPISDEEQAKIEAAAAAAAERALKAHGISVPEPTS